MGEVPRGGRSIERSIEKEPSTRRSGAGGEGIPAYKLGTPQPIIGSLSKLFKKDGEISEEHSRACTALAWKLGNETLSRDVIREVILAELNALQDEKRSDDGISPETYQEFAGRVDELIAAAVSSTGQVK